MFGGLGFISVILSSIKGEKFRFLLSLIEG